MGLLRKRVGAGLVALLATGVTVLALVTALTPARLAEVGPADGATLAQPPAEVAVRFTRVVSLREAHLTVATADGRQVAAGDPQVRGPWLVAAVQIPDAGSYLLAYHVALTDGRVFSGVTTFMVSSDGVAKPVVATAHTHSDDPLSIALTIIAAVSILALLLLLIRRPRAIPRSTYFQ